MKSTDKTAQAVARVDRILTECQRRDLDPLRVLQRAIRLHDQKQQRAQQQQKDRDKR